MQEAISRAYQDAVATLTATIDQPDMITKTVRASEWIADLFEQGKKILICGNGGSACDAMHFAEEFTGRYRKNRRALPVIALADASHITCVGNDFGFNDIFSRGVEAYGQPGDMWIGLSTSGNSENVLRALQKSQSIGMRTLSFLGKDGGKCKGQADLEWIIQAETSDRIQEVHMTILHIIIEGVERKLFPELYVN